MELGRRRTSLHSKIGLQGPSLSLVLILILSVVLLCAQSVVARSETIRTDVALFVVLYFALEHEMKRSLFVTLAVAYLSDIFSGESRGLYVASAVLVFLGVRVIALRFVRVGPFGVTALGVVATVLALAIRLCVETLVGPDRIAFSSVLPALPSLIASALVLSYPIYRLLHAIEARFDKKSEVLLAGR